MVAWRALTILIQSPLYRDSSHNPNPGDSLIELPATYLFFFFLNHVIIILRYKILHAAHAMVYKKAPSTPGKKPTSQVPLVWNQPHILPATRNPWLAKKIDERNQIKEQGGRVRKAHGTIIRTKEKQKSNNAATTWKNIPVQSVRGGPGLA